LIDQSQLRTAQMENDVVRCQEILQNAYRTDVRPLLQEARLQTGGALSPLNAYRSLKVRENLISARGKNSKASGL
jgi:L-rhamnose isomerase/sugar isomerase